MEKEDFNLLGAILEQTIAMKAENEAYHQTILYELADIRAVLEHKEVSEILDYQDQTYKGLLEQKLALICGNLQQD